MARKHSVRFESEKNARSFAKRTGGQFKDLRNDPNSRSNFKVTIDKSNPGTGGDYCKDWKEAEMNGEFAYDGATDDF